jgi:hypothetical protein
MALLRFIYVFILAFFLAQPDCEAAYAPKKQLHLSKAGSLLSALSKDKVLSDHHGVKRELERRDLTAKHTEGRERQGSSAVTIYAIFYESASVGHFVSKFNIGAEQAFTPIALLLIFPEHYFW